MTDLSKPGRLAVDIGGTFTDVALELGDRLITTKVLTTQAAPEEGVLDGIERALEEAKVDASAIGILIHGTTLATNALIERKGAKTALITTEGHRDSVEMALENRFEQYDINIDRPDPLVPRQLRWSVRERLNPAGEVLIELDEESVRAVIPLIKEHAIEALAVGLLHAYANPVHENRIREILAEAYPDMAISLASEVAPEIREYERQSTTCANAYVQPRMSSYLRRLDTALKARKFECPFLLMTSGGGLTTLETAIRFPIRLVESGPAGGAILAGQIARECGLTNVLSYDMGGTTAKICLIDDYEPLSTRTFEVARVYRNMKGSGLPVRIPAIEMVEIGAGGGSIASVDGMGRIEVGPESAGADPGPACYGRGGSNPTVTDADVVLGKIDPAVFAGGNVALDTSLSANVLASGVGTKLELSDAQAAFAVAEIVDENMANAARVHAIEWGKEITARAMIAFGGAAPLHAARLAEKLGIDTVVVPTGAGVGSAIGFLRAPISYEVVRSRYMRITEFDADAANAVLDEMSAEARAVVEAGTDGVDLVEVRVAYMRYFGQGHEITVSLPTRKLEAGDTETLSRAFDVEYTKLYGQVIPDQIPEIISWTLSVSAPIAQPSAAPAAPASASATPPAKDTRAVFDAALSDFADAAIHWRDDLPIGGTVQGPALIAEAQTTTHVTSGFEASVNGLGYLVLTRR